MNINRTHGGLKTLKTASPVTLETQKLRSPSSWLEQNYIVSGGQPRLTNPPSSFPPKPSISSKTPYMYMLTASLILTSCYGNSSARDDKGPAEVEHWWIPKGGFWPVSHGESLQLNSVVNTNSPCLFQQEVLLWSSHLCINWCNPCGWWSV